jgi:dipeptide/tripeptide permease
MPCRLILINEDKIDRKELNLHISSIVVLDQLDKLYYLRAFLGALCGVILGFILNPDTSSWAIGAIFMVGLVFYIISYVSAKKIVTKIKKEERRKLVTNGIFPFIFLLLMFMIIVYTGLYGNR